MAVFIGMGEYKLLGKRDESWGGTQNTGFNQKYWKEAAIAVTCISRIRRRVARDLESECTMESSNDSSARINICPFRVSDQ